MAANVSTPDDSSVTILPTGQVDYLSHDWREEDVWSSWRNMTRQKNAIANGTRLENASWRTWWKQRNKLKTISPETLNWLKDSDVTWLYGPLHPGVDWYPLAKSSDGTDEVPCHPTDDSPSLRSSCTKPILKHRSISEILSLPLGPLLDSDDDVESFSSKATSHTQSSELTESDYRSPLLHTKSDTHLARHGLSHPFGKTSPPGIFSNPSASSPDEDASNSTSTSSEQDLAPPGSHTGKKKHISFNTFVEQCIAIEKPKPKRPGTGPRFSVVGFDDDGYDEDSEMGSYDDSEEPLAPPSRAFYAPYQAEADSDSDSDDPIEMRTSSSRSRSSSSSRSVPVHPRHQSPRLSSSEHPSQSLDKEHRTIAYIAPTILKTTGVGNDVSVYGYEVGHQLPGLELVYVPPLKGSQNGPRYGSSSMASGGSGENHPRYDNDYFGSRRSSAQSSPLLLPKTVIPNIDGTSKPSPPSPPLTEPVHEQSNWKGDLSDSLIHSEPIGIPLDNIADEAIGDEDTFDSLVGLDLGEVFPQNRPHVTRTGRKLVSEDQRENEMVKFAQGGAESVVGGRNSVLDDADALQSALVPSVLVNPHHDQITMSPPSNIPPSPYIPVPRSASFEYSPKVTNRLLSPPEAYSSRGRTSPTPGSPISSSTTSSSTSHTRSSDSRSESRGRSSTRNSSYSDRERSGSRSSKGTSSPLGSLSPSGSAIGIGGQYTGRDGRSSSGYGVGAGRERERGRDRTGRKLGGSLSSSPSSLSPPNPTSPSRSMDYQPYQPTQADLYPSLSGSITDSISSAGSSSSTIYPSGGSSSSESTITRSIETVVERSGHSTLNSGSSSFLRNPKGISIPIPTSIPEEDEQRSRHPTPANSPVTAMRPVLPVAPPHISAPGITIYAVPTSPEKPSAPKSNSTSGKQDVWDRVGEQPQVGTLVGRAVEIVTSARGLLGSLWHTGTA